MELLIRQSIACFLELPYKGVTTPPTVNTAIVEAGGGPTAVHHISDHNVSDASVEINPTHHSFNSTPSGLELLFSHVPLKPTIHCHIV